MAAVNFVPLALLRGEQQLHQVRADAEVVAVAGDDEAGKIAHRVRIRIEHRRNQRQHIAADGVLQRVQFDAGDAVAEIHQRSARSWCGPHRARGGNRQPARGPAAGAIGSQCAGHRVEALRPIRRVPRNLAGS